MLALHDSVNRSTLPTAVEHLTNDNLEAVRQADSLCKVWTSRKTCKAKTPPPPQSFPSMSLSRLNRSVFCPAVENLTDDNLEAVRQADSLEGQLMDEMENRETDVSPWGILNRLSPLLFAWVSNQLIMLNDWSGRIQGTEDWKPVTHQRGCARSAPCVLIVTVALSFRASCCQKCCKYDQAT